MFLASLEMWISIPMIIYSISMNIATNTLYPWKSWADTHADFSRIDQFPAVLWRSYAPSISYFERTRWSVVACAFIFFGFFGFADEARKHYRSAYQSIAKRVTTSTGSFGTSSSFFNSSKGGLSSQAGSIPYFKEKLERKDSFSSSSDNSFTVKDVSGLLGFKGSDNTLNEKTDKSIDKEKKPKPNDAIFRSSFAYDALVLPDIGGCLSSPDSSSASDFSSDSSPPSSSASSVSVPEPVMTRTNSRGIEVSSLRRASRMSIPDIDIYAVPTSDSVDPRRHSHDIV
jgi:pheromone a factor receptor